MKLYITICLILISTVTFATVEIPQIAFDNLPLVKDEIGKKFPRLGLAGSREKMRVIGMDEREFSKELKRLNIQKILDDKEKAVENAKILEIEKKEAEVKAEEEVLIQKILEILDDREKAKEKAKAIEEEVKEIEKEKEKEKE